MIFSIAACNPTKRLAEGEVLLKKNKIKLVEAPEDFNISSYDLGSVVKQKPNRKILWFRFHLWAYNRVSPDRQQKSRDRKQIRLNNRVARKESKLAGLEDDNENKRLRLQQRINELKSEDPFTWRDWLTKTVGEPPVILDRSLMNKSISQLGIYLAKEGYFNNQVVYEIDTSFNGKKATAVYSIKPREAYRIRSLSYALDDAGINRRLDFIKTTSSINPGDRFQVNELDNERERITTYLNNRGYYEFTKEFISYEADSSIGNKQVDVQLNFKNLQIIQPDYPDSVILIPHKTFFIGDIYVHTDYDAFDKDYDPEGMLDYKGLKILYDGEPSLKPSLIRYFVGFSTGDLYQKSSIDKTYRRFSKIQMYRSVNIRFEPDVTSEANVLVCHIYLTRAKKQSVTTESTGTNRDGFLGVQGNLSYKHRNVFRGAENGEVNIHVGFEAQNALTESQTTEEIGGTVTENVRLNTFEIGPELTLNIHKLLPLDIERISRSSDPNTVLTAAFNYQTRPDYERTLTKFRFGYNWIENAAKGSQIFWDLWELSVIKIDKSQAFQDLLDRLNDDFLANSYQDHLISNGKVALVLNSQKYKKQRKYFFNRASFESAGNLLRAGFNLSGAQKDPEGSYTVQGIRFAQYMKLENDFRLYRNIDDRNAWAFRVFAGVGKPLDNLDVLPFEESFFAGGANGNRAWQARSLGPGSFRDTTALVTYNNIGEVKLEMSAEYRFDITPILEGAFFVDAGNIWLLQNDLDRPGGTFRTNSFLSEIAIGSGVGLRFDFDFFLVRFDFGLQLKDPAKRRGERWIWEPKEDYELFMDSIYGTNDHPGYSPVINFNLGIGYPF